MPPHNPFAAFPIGTLVTPMSIVTSGTLGNELAKSKPERLGRKPAIVGIAPPSITVSGSTRVRLRPACSPAGPRSDYATVLGERHEYATTHEVARVSPWRLAPGQTYRAVHCDDECHGLAVLRESNTKRHRD